MQVPASSLGTETSLSGHALTEADRALRWRPCAAFALAVCSAHAALQGLTEFENQGPARGTACLCGQLAPVHARSRSRPCDPVVLSDVVDRASPAKRDSKEDNTRCLCPVATRDSASMEGAQHAARARSMSCRQRPTWHCVPRVPFFLAGDPRPGGSANRGATGQPASEAKQRAAG